MFAFCLSSFDVADENSVIILFKHLQACSKELFAGCNEQGKSRPVCSCVYCFTHPGHTFNLMHTRYCYYTYSNTEELINSGLPHDIVATLFYLVLYRCFYPHSKTTCLMQPNIFPQIWSVLFISIKHK